MKNHQTSEVPATDQVADQVANEIVETAEFEIPGVDGLETSKRGGKKIRANRGYRYAKRPGTTVNDQQTVLLRILQAACVRNVKELGTPFVSEPDLQKLVEEAKTRGILDTKQDSWRIFQYYRPGFEKSGVITETQDYASTVRVKAVAA